MFGGWRGFCRGSPPSLPFPLSLAMPPSHHPYVTPELLSHVTANPVSTSLSRKPAALEPREQGSTMVIAVLSWQDNLHVEVSKTL